MSRWRKVARWAVAAGCALVAVPGADGQQDPNLARGFSPGDAYDYSGIDAVNLLNGVLNINLPIGRRYPVGDGLSYGLNLSYSSNTWDPEEEMFQGQTVIRMHPRRSSNSGHGWRISLGGTLLRRFNDLSLFATGFIWQGPDGSEHIFYFSPHVGEPGCQATRDNTYLCLSAAGSRTLPGGEVLDRYRLEFPDGMVHTYEEIPENQRLSEWDDDRFRLVEIKDREPPPEGNPDSRNWVTVAYERVGSTMTWTIQDSADRTHTVEFTQQTVDGWARWRVSKAKLRTFGGGTAEYTFVYADTPITRSCKHTVTGSPGTITVPLLTDVVLPAGTGSYRMPQYNTSCTVGQGPVDLPGTLAQLDLPTKGQLRWTYIDYLFQVPDPQLPEDPNPQIINRSTGVFEKKALNAAGECDSGAMSACTWTYVSGGGVNERTTSVTTPEGDKTVHFFRQQRAHSELPLYVGWDYGLPFSTGQPTNAGMYLSRRVYEGSSNLVREHYVLYERDRLINSHLAQNDWTNSNPRMLATRTLYHDDKLSGVPRFSEVHHDDFDGFSNYRTTIRSGNLRDAASTQSQTTTTTYNPARGTYQIDQATNLPGLKHNHSPWPAGAAWVLGTYTSMRVEEAGSAIAAQVCFDADTGRLERQRMQASASGPGGSDVIVVHQRFPQPPPPSLPSDRLVDIRYIELTYGGDGQPVNTGTDLCNLPLPATPVYRTRRVHLYGVLARIEPLVPQGGAMLGFKPLDLAIDKSTGLASSATDAAGLTTNYLYDALGRLTAIRPVAGGDAWTQIQYAPATTSALAKVTVTRRPNGSTGGTVLEESRFVYDRFGRVTRDERQIAGHGWTAVETGYNALGWKTSVTERGSGSLPHRTSVKGHDAFGRPRRIELPDYPSDGRHYVELTYNGDRRIEREVSIASNLTGGETRADTVEHYDHLGRLWRVQEPSAPNGSSPNTNYFYDAAGRLTSVRLLDTDGYIQRRDFAYDGRGFLLSETHPENGLTIYSAYDPRGHAGRKRTGVANGPFDLGFTYDAGERLTQVREWGTGRLLKEFTYGTGATAADRSNDKIKTAIRHNHVRHPDNGNQLDVTVTESYTYGGTGGRVSLRPRSRPARASPRAGSTTPSARSAP